MGHWGILSTLLFFATICGSSDAHASELFDRLVQIHETKVITQECQPDWRGYIDENTSTTVVIDDYTRLHFLPCALWSRELSWSVYVEFSEAQGDGHGLVRPVFFSAVDLQKQFVGVSQIYLWHWDSKKQQLLTQYYLQGHPNCGWRYIYQWDNRLLRFSLKKAWVKPVCDGNTD